jgi:hypothetical protein
MVSNSNYSDKYYTDLNVINSELDLMQRLADDYDKGLDDNMKGLDYDKGLGDFTVSHS